MSDLLKAALQQYLEARGDIISRIAVTIQQRTAVAGRRMVEVMAEDLVKAESVLDRAMGEHERVCVAIGSHSWTVERVSEGLLVRQIAAIV